MMQNLLVYALVTVSAAYLALRFAPAAFRRRLLQALAGIGERLGLRALARGLRQAAQPVSGCAGGCSSCSSAAPSPGPAELAGQTRHGFIPIRPVGADKPL
jgi:hypothetical protein